MEKNFLEDVKRKDRLLFGVLHLTESLIPLKILKSLVRAQKDKVRRNIIIELNKKPSSRMMSIDRVEDISPKEFRTNYMRKNLPVIFSGAAKNWECSKKWSLDFFSEHYGRDHALIVEAEGITGTDVKGHYDLLEVKDIVDSIKTDKSKYLRFSPILDNNPELKHLDLDWLRIMKNPASPADGYQLFVGGVGSRTPIHCAVQSNFFVMVKGEKRWRLFPNKYNAIINPPPIRALYSHSSVDVYNPDLDKYPAFDKIDYYDVHLKEGDILYNPPMMWHDVSNLTDSIGVGFRFGYFIGALKASASLTIMRMTANNPPLWKSLWYSMKDINLIYAASNGNFKEVYTKLNQKLQSKNKETH